jgi:hypothetical protein
VSRRRPPIGPAQRPWSARRRCRPTASPARAKQRCAWSVTGRGSRAPWWSARRRAGSRGRGLFGFTRCPGRSARLVRLSESRALRRSGPRVVGGVRGRCGGWWLFGLRWCPGCSVRVVRMSGSGRRGARVPRWLAGRWPGSGPGGCSALRGVEAGRCGWYGCLGPGCRGARVPRWLVGCRAGSGGWRVFGLTWCSGRSVQLVGDRSRGTGPGVVGGVPGGDEGPVAWRRAPTGVRVLGVTPP